MNVIRSKALRHVIVYFRATGGGWYASRTYKRHKNYGFGKTKQAAAERLRQLEAEQDRG